MTQDGSLTFWNDTVGEHYHSMTGAKEEAIRKFIEPCRLNQKQDDLVLLDVCFGWGYNTAAALDALHGRHVAIIGLEIDEQVLQSIPHYKAPFHSYPFIQQAMVNHYQKRIDGWNLSILVGDARMTIKQVPSGMIDCIFLDPFSPRKMPDLWTTEFLQELYRVLKSDGILTTYSCARSVRDNLRTAGFLVRDGPCVRRRGPSTIAEKDRQ